MTYGTQHIIRGGKEAKKFFFKKKRRKKINTPTHPPSSGPHPSHLARGRLLNSLDMRTHLEGELMPTGPNTGRVRARNKSWSRFAAAGDHWCRLHRNLGVSRWMIPKGKR